MEAVYGSYKSHGEPDSEAVTLVHRDIPKRAIPRMGIVYGTYGSLD